MKIEETNIRNIKDLNNAESYIILNTVNNGKVDKELLNVSSIADKSDILVLEEQNTKLVNVIQSIVGKLNTLEQKIEELSKSIEELSKPKEIQPSDGISNILMDIQRKLNDNILE